MEYLLGMLVATVMFCSLGGIASCKAPNPEINDNRLGSIAFINMSLDDADCC